MFTPEEIDAILERIRNGTASAEDWDALRQALSQPVDMLQIPLRQEQINFIIGELKGRDIQIGDRFTTEQILGQKNIYVSVDEIKTRKFNQTSPYKGLKKFEPEDKEFFFGRDQFITELANELERTNLLLLLGASGSGKSSVVRAGLLAWLQKEWGSRLVNLTFTPDQDPFESLYGSLLRYYKQAEAQVAREGREDTLTQVVTGLRRSDSFWFIFIDQFEELFTTSQGEKRDRFIAGLVQLNTALKLLGSTKDCPVKIVATMRADFLDRFSPYPTLVKATDKHRPLMAEMRVDELRQAIEQPAAHHGVVFETGLVEEITKDVQGQAGYLPLLQYTLNLVWDTEKENGSIHDRTLNISTYRGLGGVRGALQKRVNQIYEALPEAERLAAQRIFLKLVEIGGDEESGTEWKPVRRRALRSEFDSELEQRVLVQLIDENLLVSDRPSQAQESTVEIAHEALLTSWEMLNTWIKENRQAIGIRNRLNDDVARWQAKKAEDELWTGSKLEQVLELKKNPTFNQVMGGFSSTANQFIDASLGLRDRVRKRQIRQARTIAAVSIAAVALVSVAGVVAMLQRQETVKQKEQAERQAQIALAQQLISKAEVARRQGSTQLQVSMLLAVEGVRRLNALEVSSAEGNAILRYGLDLLKSPISRSDIERLSASHDLPNSETIEQQVKSNNCAVIQAGILECRSSGSKNVAQILGMQGASGGSNTIDFPVQIIDATTKQLLAVLPHRGHVRYTAFFGEGKYALSNGYAEADGIRYWNLGFDKGSARLITNLTEFESPSNIFNSNLRDKIRGLNLNPKTDELSFHGK
ncbi:nSTAND1 domain-containing NTPase [Phormidesmis sp. 146-33]